MPNTSGSDKKTIEARRQKVADTTIVLNNPQTKNLFREEANFLHGLSGLTTLLIKNSDILARKRNSDLETQAILTLAIDAKDHYTYGHSQRTATYAIKLGQAAGLNKEDLEEVRLAALLHDVGKICLPEKILLKPTEPTDRERLVIQKHPVISAEIIEYFKFASPQVALYVRHHHERVDGSGYPGQLKTK